MVRIVASHPNANASVETTEKTKDQAVEASSKTDASTADGYTRMGPGPLGAIRMRWTLRAVGSITFVVDEIMGENGAPVTSRPMSRDAAIKLIDERADAAHARHEQLRRELAWPDDSVAESPVAMPPGPPPID